jgi:DNA-binding transcriptional MerR regulator
MSTPSEAWSIKHTPAPHDEKFWRRALSHRPTEPYTGNIQPSGEPVAVGTGEDSSYFSSKAVADVIGLTFRQLDYWAKTGVVSPSGVQDDRRLYSYQDLLVLKAVKTLLDAGLRLESVRSVAGYLRNLSVDEMRDTNLIVSGVGSVLVRSGDEIVELLRHGQGVLNILPLAGVKDEVDAAIIELLPKNAIPLPVAHMLARRPGA